MSRPWTCPAARSQEPQSGTQIPLSIPCWDLYCRPRRCPSLRDAWVGRRSVVLPPPPSPVNAASAPFPSVAGQPRRGLLPVCAPPGTVPPSRDECREETRMTLNRRAFGAATLGFAAGGALATLRSAAAQSDHPSRSVTTAVPFPAGGSTDPVARL